MNLENELKNKEKIIEELQKEVQLWKKSSEINSHKAFQLQEELKSLRLLKIENKDLIERVNKLEGENQKLLQSCEGATMIYNDLKKAKVIIRGYHEILCGNTANWQKVQAEAEAFIKE